MALGKYQRGQQRWPAFLLAAAGLLCCSAVKASPSNVPAQHFSPLKFATVSFSPEKQLDGEFEFVIKNEAGESKPVGGFKIVK